MSGTPKDLTRAKYEADQARKKFGDTLGALRYRLKPATLASGAWEGVRDKSADLADEALHTAKERPRAAAGVAAALVLFLARRPIISGVSRLFSKKEEARQDEEAEVLMNIQADGI